MSTAFTRDMIKQAPDLELLREPVPEWGGEDFVLLLQEMSAADAMSFRKLLSDDDGGGHGLEGMFLIIIFCAVNEQREKLFTLDTDDEGRFVDVEMLKTKNLDVLNRLQLVCLKLNGMGQKAGVDLKKGLSEAVTDASHSS